MNNLLITATMMLLAIPAVGAIKTQKVEYKAGDKTMVGYLAYNDSTDAKRPGVLVFPEWWGNNNYSHQRAEQLAQLGYVGFAVDMYGEGKTTDDPNEAGKLAGEVKTNPKLGFDRAHAALDTLKAQ